ncbi:hypothetical protein [Clostridium magnum]|uniref:Uncharacterized protein n=1 Tax=Clostridium magnum DSM 2767 TaxID=1121326 RepID=A0A162TDL4_9CLOT|nr:hypothetical protein [Clostridium magnum]KZL92511.1 hypothetical protein CLMAG_23200 [Clostridium magnum DSM 2767]SHI22905.1 hypothetical protein SAMN02745944_03393 [Clostridium magnum DSM 2767]
MNKIKLLYDVFKTMKEKESFNVNIKLDAVKGEEKVLSFSNEFNTNTTTGESKAKINSEFNCDGKKVKHESNTEFNMKDCKHHKFHHHMGHHAMGCCEHGGIKAKLSKITFILNILNNLKAEEKDGISILSLNLKDIINEIKDQHKDLAEHHKNFHTQEMGEYHKHCDFIKELLCSENSDAELNIYINKNNEVEKIEVSAKGENSLDALVNFNW